MLKTLVRVAVIVVACLSLFVPSSAAQLNVVSPETVVFPASIIPTLLKDPRMLALDEFFKNHKCPYNNSVPYLSAAQQYGLDYRLMPALSVMEEGCGRQNPGNNLFGYYETYYKDGKKLHRIKPYETIEAGIDDVGSYLGTSKLYKNRTLKQTLNIYNAGTPDKNDVNPKYYFIVNGLINEMPEY